MRKPFISLSSMPSISPTAHSPRLGVMIFVLGLGAGGCGSDSLNAVCGGCDPGQLCGSDDECHPLCTTSRDCGSCQECFDNLCYPQGSGCVDDCTPQCAGKCGGPDQCGATCPDNCVGPATCGGGGTPNVCGAPEGPSACALPWGGTIDHGQSVTAYASGSVACGSACSSQTRFCNNGILSGSYAAQACDVETCCVANAGEICDAGHWATAPGCRENYGCASFVGIYYNSPNGCDPATAGGFVEYMFDGTNELARGGGDFEWDVVGDAASAYHCTYVGFSPNDPFHNTPDGSCVNSTARGYSIPDTYTRVVPGTGCEGPYWVPDSGTIRCDGSCL